MALVVEDGTGLDTAESFISVADADTYHTEWNADPTAWTGATTAQTTSTAKPNTAHWAASPRFRSVAIQLLISLPTTGHRCRWASFRAFGGARTPHPTGRDAGSRR